MDKGFFYAAFSHSQGFNLCSVKRNPCLIRVFDKIIMICFFVVCNQFYGFCSHIFPPVSDLSPNSCRHKINCCIFFISIKHTYTDALTEFVNLSKI